MNTDTFYRHRICTLSFKDESWIKVSDDCVYKEHSQTFSVTSSSDNNENETWILVGVLDNGDTFNMTVQKRSSPDKPGHVSFILVVAVSVGVIVSITFVTIITVSCVRSKNNLIVETR
ncbi:hypothetical protein V1264_016798 [Littorina saxatilis]|uniref:Uncharacterized protein n=1 Tax=Littorina saxatilis TaxID=31220 RepID=A0AAN9BLC2_9CAEN